MFSVFKPVRIEMIKSKKEMRELEVKGMNEEGSESEENSVGDETEGESKSTGNSALVVLGSTKDQELAMGVFNR